MNDQINLIKEGVGSVGNQFLSDFILMWLLRGDYLLQADGVGLGFAVLTQFELPVELLGQVAVAALAEQRDFSMELHSPLKDILRDERKRRHEDISWRQKK